MTLDEASIIAISGLQCLADKPELLTRFSVYSGLNPDEIRENASSAEFLAAVLDFFLQDEPALLTFSDHANIAPQSVGQAKLVLSPPLESDGW